MNIKAKSYLLIFSLIIVVGIFGVFLLYNNKDKNYNTSTSVSHVGAITYKTSSSITITNSMGDTSAITSPSTNIICK